MKERTFPFKDGPRLATWLNGVSFNENSDIFMTWDGGEGSDFDVDFPEDIRQKISEIAKDNGQEFCVIWLTNLDSGDTDLPMS